MYDIIVLGWNECGYSDIDYDFMVIVIIEIGKYLLSLEKDNILLILLMF